VSEDPRLALGEAWTLGFTLVGLVLVFTGLGYVLDRWLHTAPWLMIGGVFVGAGLGFAYLVAILFFRPHDGGRGGGTRGTEKAEDQK
jgi:F0F1-type ATP synthase assembly protein I